MTIISNCSVSICSAEMSHRGLELLILWTTVAGQTKNTKLLALQLLEVSVSRSSGYWHRGIVSPSFVRLQHETIQY